MTSSRLKFELIDGCESSGVVATRACGVVINNSLHCDVLERVAMQRETARRASPRARCRIASKIAETSPPEQGPFVCDVRLHPQDVRTIPALDRDRHAVLSPES